MSTKLTVATPQTTLSEAKSLFTGVSAFALHRAVRSLNDSRPTDVDQGLKRSERRE